jgi:hypothetical protein
MEIFFRLRFKEFGFGGSNFKNFILIFYIWEEGIFDILVDFINLRAQKRLTFSSILNFFIKRLVLFYRV